MTLQNMSGLKDQISKLIDCDSIESAQHINKIIFNLLDHIDGTRIEYCEMAETFRIIYDNYSVVNDYIKQLRFNKYIFKIISNLGDDIFSLYMDNAEEAKLYFNPAEYETNKIFFDSLGLDYDEIRSNFEQSESFEETTALYKCIKIGLFMDGYLKQDCDDNLLVTFIKMLNSKLYKIVEDRKNFYSGNNIIKAGGAILYKYMNGKLYFLMIYKGNTYEDLGGKSKVSDRTYYSMICREVMEESNNLIILKEYKLSNHYNIYLAHAKYMLYFLEATNEQSKLEEEDFGLVETAENIKRSIKWVDVDNLFGHNINNRLNSDLFFDAIKYLSK